MVVCNGASVCFLQGDLLTNILSIPSSWGYLGSMSGWVSLREPYISQWAIFIVGVIRLGKGSMIHIDILPDVIMSSWSYPWVDQCSSCCLVLQAMAEAVVSWCLHCTLHVMGGSPKSLLHMGVLFHELFPRFHYILLLFLIGRDFCRYCHESSSL